MAAMPLVVGASYITLGPCLDVGPFHFTVIRILIAVGVARVVLKGEHLQDGLNGLDCGIIAWAAWTVVSGLFHKQVGEVLVFRLGMAYNALGLYFLLRIFIHDTDEMREVCRFVILALIPIAIEMVSETQTGRNLFSMFGGVYELSEVRGGKVRAQGPFAHSILAGTVGAVCVPMAMQFWSSNRRLAILGLVTTGSIVVASRSSGPLMSVMAAAFALTLWKVRTQMQFIRRAGLIGLLGLALVMQAPIYYLLARVDLTGSSTGYHRAILVEAAIKHLDEWWLWGTDYTRHWTPNGGFGDDTDVTNHYIRMGIWGGLPLMFFFVWLIIVAFTLVSKALRRGNSAPVHEQFLVWALGCSLFAHVATMMSVSFFDQSVFYLYLVLAAIGSTQTLCAQSVANEFDPVHDERHFSYSC